MIANISLQRRIRLALALGLFGFALACAPFGSAGRPTSAPLPTAPPASPVAPIELEAKYANVLYRPPSSAEQPVQEGQKLAVARQGAVSVNSRGEAWLYFPQALIVRVYEQSQLTIEGQVNPDTAPSERIRLESGAMFGSDIQSQASKHVSIEAGWAVIEDVGTQFLVYYDSARQLTWVAVADGATKVTAGGQTVQVPAGWQTWVAPNVPPRPPIPASRTVIGGLFPAVEAITGARLSEGDVLTNKQCSVANLVPGDALNLRTEPSTQSDQTIVDSMPLGAHFEALGRTRDDPRWIYGLSPNGFYGWAAASFLHCDYDTTLLTVDLQQLPIPTATPVPPTLIPSPTPSATPSPTATPTPRDTTAPIIQPPVRPRELSYPKCGGSHDVTLSVSVSDSSGSPSIAGNAGGTLIVKFRYQLIQGNVYGPIHPVDMQSKGRGIYSAEFDLGAQVWQDFKDGGVTSMAYSVTATDAAGNKSKSLIGRLPLGASEC